MGIVVDVLCDAPQFGEDSVLTGGAIVFNRRCAQCFATGKLDQFDLVWRTCSATLLSIPTPLTTGCQYAPWALA